MEKKAERERAWEEEQKEIKAAKEREIARLRALQERQQDQQAQADELAATRAADEVSHDSVKKLNYRNQFNTNWNYNNS